MGWPIWYGKRVWQTRLPSVLSHSQKTADHPAATTERHKKPFNNIPYFHRSQYKHRIYGRIWLSSKRCVLASIPTLSPFGPGGPGKPCNNMSITDHITWEREILMEDERKLMDIVGTVFQNHFKDTGENSLFVLMILGDPLVLGDLGIHWLPIGKVMQGFHHESYYSIILPHYRHLLC